MVAPLRIKSVEPSKAALTLNVVWADGTKSCVDLTGLVHSSRHFKVFADDPAAFRRVKLVSYGTGIGWENGLDYSASTLKTLADEQRTLDGGDLATFETRFGLNTAETAALLHIAERTVRAYRAADALPETVAMALRSFQADPTIFAAHYRPVARRERGRPRKAKAA
jgi:DNA-binding transcriptional regulator YiaG